MAEKERFAPPAVGGSSLLIIFAVLCLTIFALLGLATVQADRRLSDASAQAVEAYYAADTKAQEILAFLRTTEFDPGLIDLDVALDWRSDGERAICACSYAVPISDTQELRVEVLIDGDSYEILRWQSVPTGAWEPDTSLNVWDGGAGPDDGIPLP